MTDDADPPPLDLPPAQEARDDDARDRAWIVASLAASQDLTDAEYRARYRAALRAAIAAQQAAITTL